jgi:hypothetical protein
MMIALSLSCIAQTKTTATGTCAVSHSGNNDTIIIKNCGLSAEQTKKLTEMLTHLVADHDGINQKLDTLREIVEPVGDLTPANDPMPDVSSICRQNAQFVSPTDSLILAGGGISAVPLNQRISLVSIGGNPLLWMDATSAGISVSGHVYNANGAMVRIDHNHFEVNKNIGFTPSHPDDHTLILNDNWDHTVLRLRFANPHLITMSGVFFYPNHPPVTVEETGIHIGGITLSGGCTTRPGPNFKAVIGVD